jgi:hypothetical protein
VGATYFPRAVVLTTVSQPVNVCHSHGLVAATIARAAAAAEANMKLPAKSCSESLAICTQLQLPSPLFAQLWSLRAAGAGLGQSRLLPAWSPAGDSVLRRPGGRRRDSEALLFGSVMPS